MHVLFNYHCHWYDTHANSDEADVDNDELQAMPMMMILMWMAIGEWMYNSVIDCEYWLTTEWTIQQIFINFYHHIRKEL